MPGDGGKDASFIKLSCRNQKFYSDGVKQQFSQWNLGFAFIDLTNFFLDSLRQSIVKFRIVKVCTEGERNSTTRYEKIFIFFRMGISTDCSE